MERDDSRARCALPTLCTTQVGHRVLSAELDRKAVGTISSKLVFLISVPIAASQKLGAVRTPSAGGH